jgi:hypothetical protein
MADQLIYSIAFLAICHLVILVTIVWVILAVFKKFVFGKSVFNRKHKLIALGLSAVLFRSTLYNAIIYPVGGLVFNLQKLFYNYQAIAEINNSPASGTDPNQLPNIDVSIAEIVKAFPLANVLIFLAACILIYRLILFIDKRVSGSSQTPTESTISFTFYFNLLICAILAFSLFLVISVFISIPYLNEMRKPTVYTKDRMDSLLNTLSRASQLDADSSKLSSFMVSPFFSGTDTVTGHIFDNSTRANYTKLRPASKSLIDRRIAALQFENDRSNKNRSRAISALTDFQRNYGRKKEKVRLDLSVNFDSKSQSLNVDKAALFLTTKSVFENFSESSSANFSEFMRAIQSTDQLNSSLLQNAITSIQQDIGQIAIEESRPDSVRALNDGFYSFSQFVTYQETVDDPYYSTYLPVLEKDGSDWGLFGLIAKYLIRTQSSELVLLMGMFGFGLLGASILSFEKMSPKEFLASPIIKNFGNVLARGFGAALVVYMAIKAGLTIFTAGTSTDANGYMLLLTCFAAAVFSDKIWEKMKDWVSK